MAGSTGVNSVFFFPLNTYIYFSSIVFIFFPPFEEGAELLLLTFTRVETKGISATGAVRISRPAGESVGDPSRERKLRSQYYWRSAAILTHRPQVLRY